MHRGDKLPLVGEDTPIKDALFEITSKRLGITGVVDEEGKLTGVITDGDLRRGLESKGDIFRYNAKQLMTRNAKSISADCLAAEAVAVMEQHSITCLFVLHENGKAMGAIHLHDLLKAGL